MQPRLWWRTGLSQMLPTLTTAADLREARGAFPLSGPQEKSGLDDPRIFTATKTSFVKSTSLMNAEVNE